MKKISKLVCLLFLSLLLAGCGGSKADMVETPANMRMQRGRNYREVIEDFQDKGFTNIKTNKIEDLQYGFVVRYEQVETITVGGDSNYDSGVKVPADTEVIINCCGVKELATGLLTDTLDLVVTIQNSVKLYNEFECIDAASIGKILLFAASHPLAQKDISGLTLKDFSNDLFIAPWEIVDKMIIDAISNYTRPYGFVPKLRFVKNHESTVTCVRNNMGVMIADDWVWAKNADDLRWIPFNAQDSISIARLKTRGSDDVLAMEEILLDILKNHKSA